MTRVIACVALTWACACVPDEGFDPPPEQTDDDGGFTEDEGEADGPTVCFESPMCDPLSPSCGGAEVCVPTSSGFECAPPIDGTPPLQLGQPCSGALACGEGLACLTVAVPGCTGEPGCCVAFCELDAPDCPDDLACQAFYSGPPLPCYETVGVCH